MFLTHSWNINLPHRWEKSSGATVHLNISSVQSHKEKFTLWDYIFLRAYFLNIKNVNLTVELK